MASYTARQHHIRVALQSPRAERLSPRLRRLANAVWQIPMRTAEHAACQAALPALLDAELDGQPIALADSPARQHLLVCAECAELAVECLTALSAPIENPLTQARMPAPNLDFLESRNV